MNHTPFQPMTPENCRLTAKQVDIWQFSLANQPIQALALLDNEEKARASRFYFERHQRRFTIARAMMRLILGRYLGIDPAKLVFSYNKQGKPYLTYPHTIEFNLSHSEDLALLAVGKTYPVGIDLEYYSARPYEGIAEQLFSHQERQALKRLAPELQPLCFFHIWSQKEAFIKACGLGLSYPTKQFTVPSLPMTNELINDSLLNKNWRIVSFMPVAGCCAAVCYDPSIKFLRKITINNLDTLFSKITP
jgi:4'-phosphopantetheinyl transferase